MEGFLVWTPPPLQKFHFSVILSFKKIGLLKPSSALEFPLTFLGVGMDIFWNYTFEKDIAVFDWSKEITRKNDQILNMSDVLIFF